jgi:hypothetical protein
VQYWENEPLTLEDVPATEQWKRACYSLTLGMRQKWLTVGALRYFGEKGTSS